jgi:hypothetical protein
VLRKTPIFCWKLAKIAENWYHNIDPLRLQSDVWNPASTYSISKIFVPERINNWKKDLIVVHNFSFIRFNNRYACRDQQLLYKTLFSQATCVLSVLWPSLLIHAHGIRHRSASSAIQTAFWVCTRYVWPISITAGGT